MARQGSIEGITNFIGGLNTSIGPLNNPGNTLSTAYNIEIGLDGSLSSRRPFSIQEGLSDPTLVGVDSHFGAYLSNVNDNVDNLSDLLTDSNTQILSIDSNYWQSKDVQCIIYQGYHPSYDKFLAVTFLREFNGNIFFTSGFSMVSLTGGRSYFGSVHFGSEDVYIPYKVTASQVAQVRGYAINYESLEPVNFFGLEYRDFAGVPSYKYDSQIKLDMDDTPTSVSYFYLYNKINSGWPRVPVPCTTNEAGSDTDNLYPVMSVREEIGKFSSLGHNYWEGTVKDATNYDAIGAFSPWQMIRQKVSESAHLPTGSIILPLGGENTRQGRMGSVQTQVLNSAGDAFITVVSNNNPVFSTYLNESEKADIELNCLGEIDGRMWYNFDGRDFNIAFSQIKHASNAGWRANCYQEADPTDDITNTIVATDGGTMSITGLGKVSRFMKYGTSVILFCDNGIWAISGAESGTQFTPSSYSVSKISSESLLNSNMFCETPNGVFYMTQSGVNVLTFQEGYLRTDNLSKNRVDKEVNQFLSMSSKSGSINFDKISGRLYINFMENDTVTSDMHTLVFDTKLNCFYKWELYSGSAEYTSSFTSPKSMNRKIPITLCAFNNIGVVSVSINPSIDIGNYIDFLQGNNIHARGGSSSTGIYVHKQPEDGVYGSYDEVSLHDFGYASSYESGGSITTGYSSYPCSAKIPHPNPDFNMHKIVENISVIYRNGPFSDDLPTAGTNSAGVDRFVKPTCYLGSYWDWGTTQSAVQEIIADIKYPYVLHYSAEDILVHTGKIPGRGRGLQLEFSTPRGEHTTGFKIYGYLVTLSKAM